MEINQHQVLNHKIIIIDNFYDNIEYDAILEECLFLGDKSKLDDPQTTGSARQKHEIIKNNHGLFLDDFYGVKYRKISNILKYNRKQFTQELLDTLEKIDTVYRFTKVSRKDYTLFSYYDNGDYYKSHTDEAKITTLTWLYQTPKSFTGGDLIFNDTGLKVECVNNRMIFFPSFLYHEVTPVKLKKADIDKRKGRFTISRYPLQ